MGKQIPSPQEKELPALEVSLLQGSLDKGLKLRSVLACFPTLSVRSKLSVATVFSARHLAECKVLGAQRGTLKFPTRACCGIS